MAQVRIYDPITRRPAEFDGVEIARTSTRFRPGQWRWNELTVWKIPGASPGGPPRWAFRKAGLSLVYHRADTGCTTMAGRQSGRPATVDDLPDDAVPCRDCCPADPETLADRADAGELVRVRFEFPREMVKQFGSPAGVVEAATVKVDRDRNVSVGMSEPVADLLAQCMTDRDFRAGAGDLPAAV